ncbi:MAG TPA: hypothetical protein VG889_16520 [Rhizomicrobium sp.]|nr:hypothetical protein [Rhizomicrobium sp.]
MRERLEHYSDRTSIKVVVAEYNAAAKRYRVTVEACVLLRSYVDDIATTYSSPGAYDEVTLPPEGGSPNRLIYARVDGAAIPGSGRELTTDIRYPISAKVEPWASCEVEYQVSFWMDEESEWNSSTPDLEPHIAAYGYRVRP